MENTEIKELRKDFIQLVGNEELKKDEDLRNRMLKMSINNFFDYLERKLGKI